jgi:RHS repeat-associated protein
VTYTYSNTSTTPVKLTSIQSSDGRSIALTYYATSGYLWKVTTNLRTWTYGYTGSTLTSVVLPDGKQWTYDFDGLSYAIIDPDTDYTGRTCDSNNYWIGGGGSGTATHPSGAIGTFVVSPARYGRSNVPKFCTNWEQFNDKTNDVAVVPKTYEVLSIASKTIAGPGLAEQNWTFDGASDHGWADGTPMFGPWTCESLDCLEPVCVSDTCAGVTVSTVTGPGGRQEHYTFGNSYRYNEGKLLSIQRGTATTILEEEVLAYELTQASTEFATPLGRTLQDRGAGFESEYPRPQSSRIVYRDGATFTYSVNLFDSYLRPTNVDRFSSLINPTTGLADYAKNEVTEYHDVATGAWILGQVKKVTVDGVIAARTDFDAANLPWKTYQFELLQQTLTYNADGTVASVKDGKGNTTTPSDWYRGVPRMITFADATQVEASVNGSGWITQVIDQLDTVTNYDYDAMGRLTLIDYTDVDSTAWLSTNRTFDKSTVTAFNGSLAAGHWTQVVWTANGRTTTWYDARWNPVVVLTEDTANAATKSYVVNRYDADGRVVFQSYPVASLASINDTLAGTTTVYDTIGRVKEVKQDSELGVLTTATSYEAPFAVRVTNPRGIQSISQFQAFDVPTTEAPSKIIEAVGLESQAEGEQQRTTLVTRDEFGKPNSLRRSGTLGGAAISATRNYTYDTHRRLCMQVEPETGATVISYDLANNILWTATGLTPTPASCDASVPVAKKITRTYDVMNRVLVVDVPNSTDDPTYDYFFDGALKSLDNGSAQWDYTYNLRRLPLTETLNYAGRTRTLSHLYNTNGHETTTTYPSGLVVTLQPDALGRPTRAGSYAHGAAFHPNGGMNGFTYGACAGTDCVMHSMTRNARGLPLLSRDKRAGATAILDDTYAYDASGNVTQIADGAGGGGSRSMTYDALDRITNANAPGLSWINATTSYDALDNIRSNQVGSRLWTYNYDANNRLATLLKPASTAITYDANGNIVGHGTTQYVFDTANRMTQATGKETYVYDGHGRRVGQTRTSDNKSIYPFYSLAGVLINEEDVRDNVIRDYLYLNGSLVAKRSKPIGTSTWTTKYVYTDSLGSPVAESDAAASVTHNEKYTPYGEQTDTINGSPLEQGPAFTAHVTDSVTGLSYMQQRYYDPQVGRFLSVDPIAPDGSTGAKFNRYAYALNNPLRFTDPDGRDEEAWAHLGDAVRFELVKRDYRKSQARNASIV